MMNEPSDHHTPPDLEQLWQFAGQGLRSSDFTSAMIHFYRGEVSRSNTWRARLDMTTNWAVITAGAALTFSFSSPNNTHLIIIIDTLLILLFLFIEARRYRYYELWAYRVRLMELNFFAGILSPPFQPTAEWADKITTSLRRPAFPISLGEAFGRRYRRNYAFIFLILALAWLFKVATHPVPAHSVERFLDNAVAGPISGSTMLLLGILFNGILLGIGLFTTRLRESTAEILSSGETDHWLRRLGKRARSLTWEVFEMDLPRLPLPHLHEGKMLAYVITDKEEAVSKAVIQGLQRGVTRLEGHGMYTGKRHGVLMCAFNASQAQRLRSLVLEVDSEAFVIITGVQDIRGSGFRPLEA